MKKNLFLILLTFFFSINSCKLTAQNTSPTLYAEVVAGPNLYFHKVVPAFGKGCLLSCLTDNKASVLVRIDSIGSILWKSITGPNNFNTDVLSGPDSTFYTVSNRFNNSLNTGVIVSKLNDHGTEIWSQKLTLTSGQDTIIPTSLASTADSGIVVCGSVRSSTMSTFIARYDTHGSLLWSKRVQIGNSVSGFTAIRQTSDSGYILAGPINGLSLLKIDKSGSLNWAASYSDNNGPVLALDISVKKNRVFVGVLEHSLALFECDLAGNVLMGKSYGTNYFNQGNYLKAGPTADQGLYLATGGTYYSSFLKVDSTGKVQWETGSGETAGGGTQLRDGSYIIAYNGPLVAVRLAGPNTPQVGLTKFDSLGQHYGCIRSASPSYTNIASFLSTSSTYTSVNDGSSLPTNVASYSVGLFSFAGCVDVIGGLKNYFNTYGISVFPNPSKGNFTVQWENIPQESVTYSFYNLSGSLIKQESSKEEIQHLIDSSTLPPSVYLLKISIHGQTIKNERLVITP